MISAWWSTAHMMPLATSAVLQLPFEQALTAMIRASGATPDRPETVLGGGDHAGDHGAVCVIRARAARARVVVTVDEIDALGKDATNEIGMIQLDPGVDHRHHDWEARGAPPGGGRVDVCVSSAPVLAHIVMVPLLGEQRLVDGIELLEDRLLEHRLAYLFRHRIEGLLDGPLQRYLDRDPVFLWSACSLLEAIRLVQS